MFLIETVVCSGVIGKEARLMRMLEVRQEFKRRQQGCVSAWVGRNPEQREVLIVQSVFVSQEAWRDISQKAMDLLDEKDGGIESLLSGPPLVGLFETNEQHLELKRDTNDVA